MIFFKYSFRVEYQRKKIMRDREYKLETTDLGLLIFVVVAGWLLVFQSGLF